VREVSLVGGGVGGAIRFVHGKIKGSKVAGPLDIVIGLLMGVVTSGLGGLGLNVTNFDVGPIANELAVFLVAVGGGLAGPSIFSALGKRSAAPSS
jgi:hypothetical protein